MKISFKNLHKPTSAFMTKIAASCVAISTVISAWAALLDSKPILFAGLVLAVLGAAIPPLLEEKPKQPKDESNKELHQDSDASVVS